MQVLQLHWRCDVQLDEDAKVLLKTVTANKMPWQPRVTIHCERESVAEEKEIRFNIGGFGV